MVRIEKVSPLTDFKRYTAKFRARMKKSGQHELLTVEGRGEIVVQDAAAYQKMLDDMDRMEAIEGIRKGLASSAAGLVRPMDDVIADLRRRFGARQRRKSA